MNWYGGDSEGFLKDVCGTPCHLSRVREEKLSCGEERKDGTFGEINIFFSKVTCAINYSLPPFLPFSHYLS